MLDQGTARPRGERAPDAPTCWARMETAAVSFDWSGESRDLALGMLYMSPSSHRVIETVLIELFEAQRATRTSSRTYRTYTQSQSNQKAIVVPPPPINAGRAVDHDEMHKWQKRIHFYRVSK